MVQQQEKQLTMSTMNLTFMKKELEDNAKIMSLNALTDKSCMKKCFLEYKMKYISDYSLFSKKMTKK